MSLYLDEHDLALAAEACRKLAQHYRDEAQQRKDPSLRAIAIAKSLQAERLAERLDAERSALN